MTVGDVKSTDIARGFTDDELRQLVGDMEEESSGIYEGEAKVVLNFVVGDKGGETVVPCVVGDDAEALNAQEWDMLGGEEVCRRKGCSGGLANSDGEKGDLGKR